MIALGLSNCSPVPSAVARQPVPVAGGCKALPIITVMETGSDACVTGTSARFGLARAQGL